jgi:electron transport complex protein RnfD
MPGKKTASAAYDLVKKNAGEKGGEIMSSNNMTVSFAPHIQDKVTTSRIMLDVIIALSPALAASIYVHQHYAALLIGVCVASCVFFEWVFEKILKRKNTVSDLSAIVTGILFAFCLPFDLPLWKAVLGSFVAIIFVKQLFGGLGKNFANPAITARVLLLVTFPAYMTAWTMPFFDSSLTSKPFVALSDLELSTMPEIFDSLMYIYPLSDYLGEANGVALLIGGIYLLFRRVITWHIPVTFIGTVFALTAISGNYPVFQVFSGGLLLGAIFMAADYVTSPLTKAGRVIFGMGAGLLTVLIRLYGTFPEAVSYAILLMNMLVPFIDKFTVHKALGEKSA